MIANATAMVEQKIQTRWRREILMFLLGALAACALPPVYSVPVLLISFPGFLFFMENTSKKRCFILGWYFGFGFFTAGLYWISNSLRVDLEQFFWLIPFALFGIPAVLACFIGIIAMLLYRFDHQDWVGKSFAFSIFWTAVEWFRGQSMGDLNFPWNLISTVWCECPGVLHVSSYIGAYGLSLLTTLLFSLTIVWWIPEVKKTFANIMIALIVIFFTAETIFLPNVSTKSGPYIRIVQPNVSQIEKWDSISKDVRLNELLEISSNPSQRQIAYTVWPESAVPFYLDESKSSLHAIKSKAQGIVITGTIRRTLKSDGSIDKLYNSVMAIDNREQIITSYDKVHLVPFGEYIPWRFLFPAFVKKVTSGWIDFSPGQDLKVINVNDHPFGVLICFEVLFPGKVVNRSLKRPKWLINVTNDAWFGISSGPYQHLAAAQMRASEEGIPIVRAANSGVSAIIDSYGRIIASLDLNVRGYLDEALPMPAPITIFGQYGNWTFIVFLLFIIMLAWFHKRYIFKIVKTKEQVKK